MHKHTSCIKWVEKAERELREARKSLVEYKDVNMAYAYLKNIAEYMLEANKRARSVDDWAAMESVIVRLNIYLDKILEYEYE